MIYAVIDTNILVSALLSCKADSATVVVMEKVLNGEITAVFNADILAEYRAVLMRPKFGFSPDLVATLIAYIEQNGLFVPATPTGEVLNDMDDLPFYEVFFTLADKNAYLITGNIKHFPVHANIVTARAFLNIIQAA